MVRSLDMVALSPNDDVNLIVAKANANFQALRRPSTVANLDSQQVAELILPDVIAATQDFFLPIGCIVCVQSLSDPRLARGTWTQVFQGRFPLGADATHPAGTQGGAGDVTLDADDLPLSYMQADLQAGQTDVAVSEPQGPQAPVSTMPPWEAVYWMKRIS